MTLQEFRFRWKQNRLRLHIERLDRFCSRLAENPPILIHWPVFAELALRHHNRILIQLKELRNLELDASYSACLFLLDQAAEDLRLVTAGRNLES